MFAVIEWFSALNLRTNPAARSYKYASFAVGLMYCTGHGLPISVKSTGIYVTVREVRVRIGVTL